MTDPRPPGRTHFDAVRLRMDGRSPSLRRLDAQAAVDVARRESNLARHALLATSTAVASDTVRAQVAADRATSVLAAAVALLTACDADVPPGGDPVPLRVDVLAGTGGGMTVVRPRGELDMVTSPALERACVAQLDGPGATRLVVDLSEVTFLDSSGLAALVELERVCSESGTTTFAVRGANVRTRRLLSITRLDTVIDVG